MNIELQSNKENEHINLFNVIKAEGRKVIDTQVAKVILGVTFFLTVAMFIVSLILLKNQTTWIDSYSMISGPATTMLYLFYMFVKNGQRELRLPPILLYPKEIEYCYLNLLFC